MSSSGIISNNNGKIFNDLLPNPYPYPAVPPSLAQVLIAGDDAGNGNIENLLQIQTTNVVQQAQIGGHLTIGGTPLNPGSGGDLRIQGATTIGSLLVGNGTSTLELPVGANGLVLKANSGAVSGLGVEWGTDASGGTVMAVNAGDNINITGTIAQPIVNVSNPFFVQKVNAPNTTNLTLECSAGGEQSDITLNAINATTGVSTQAFFGADDSVGGNGGIVKVIITDPAVASTSVIGQVLPTTATHDTRWANAVQTSDFASHLVQSELNQTKLRCETIDTANQVNSVREDLTIAGVMLDTHTGTQLGTNIVAQRTEQTGYTLGCNQILQYTNPASIQATQSQQTSSLGATYQGITEDFPFGALHKGAFGMSATTTQGEVSALYEDFSVGAVYQSTGATICNAGGSTVQISSSSISAGSSHLLRMECGQVGNALIEHTSVGSVRNLGIQSQGYIEIKNPVSLNNIFCGSGGLGITLNSNSGNLGLNAIGGSVGISAVSGVSILAGQTAGNTNTTLISNSGVGGQAYPLMTLTNTNATGSVATEIYKNKPTAGALGDVLALQSVYGKDSTNAKQEYTRITHSIRDPTGGSEDGSIEFACIRAGSINAFLQLNGVENEVNCLKNLDMTGNNIITNTGDMTISTATSATGTGRLTLQSKEKLILSAEATHELELNANSYSFTTASALSPSAGSNSGQHLAITINGVPYKIQLLNP